MAEQRTYIRKDSSLRAEIVLSSAASVPCIVRNVSARGAKIDVGAQVELPPEFTLRASELDLDVLARTVWRTGTEMGVKFPLKFALS